jgi:hypothetical protein
VDSTQEPLEQPNRSRKQRRKSNAQVNAVDQGAVAIFALARAEGLRNESIEAEQESLAKKRQHDEDAGTKTNRAHGHRTVGKAADHHGVHDGHAHPAKFGENQGERQAESGADFRAENL